MSINPLKLEQIAKNHSTARSRMQCHIAPEWPLYYTIITQEVSACFKPPMHGPNSRKTASGSACQDHHFCEGNRSTWGAPATPLLPWTVLGFKRSSGEDARAFTASSGGKHRFEKYMPIPFVLEGRSATAFVFWGRSTEKTKNGWWCATFLLRKEV